MRNPANYDKPAARAILQCMLDVLATGPATTIELMVATGKSKGRARDYLMHLRTIGQVRCLAEAVFSFEGSLPAVWEIVPTFLEPECPDVMDDSIDYCPQRVIIRASWPPNHFRDALCCYLFGVPSAMQAAA